MGFRIWLGLTLFFIYGFAWFIPTTDGLFQSFSWDHWSAYLELIGAGIVSWQFLRISNVAARLPADHPGVGFINFGLGLFVVYFFVDLCVSMFSSTRGGLFVALAAYHWLFWVQPLFMILISVGALQMLLSLDPLHSEQDAAAEAEADAAAPAGAVAAAPGAAAANYPDSAAGSPVAPAAPAPAPATPLAVARERLLRNRDDLAAYAAAQNLLAQEGDAVALRDHNRQYIDALLRQSRADKAYDLTGKCLARDPEFKPLAESVAPLARLALGLKDHKFALRLLNGFSKANPGHADTPHIYLLSARALADAGQRDMASKFLEALLARYPNTVAGHQGKALLQAMNAVPTSA